MSTLTRSNRNMHYSLLIIILCGDGCLISTWINAILCSVFSIISLHMLKMGITADNVTRSQRGNVFTLTFFTSSHLTSVVGHHFHATILRYRFTTKSSASSSRTIFISSNIELVLHPPSLVNSFIMKSMRVASSSPK